MIGKEIRKSRREGFRGDFGIEEGKRMIREGNRGNEEMKDRKTKERGKANGIGNIEE